MSPSQRSLWAEALGSFLLFATVIGSGIMAERLSGGNVAVALLGNTLATGAMLFVLITMLGPVSGAHFNPAVTLVMRLRHAITTRAALTYGVAQMAGGVLGVWSAHAMFDLPVWQVSHHIRTGPGQWLGEGIATFGLVLTILGTVQARAAWVPASVALYITAAYWFTSSTSFANPPSLTRALSDSFAGIAPASVPGFIAAQLVGALAAHHAAKPLHPAKDIHEPPAPPAGSGPSARPQARVRPPAASAGAWGDGPAAAYPPALWQPTRALLFPYGGGRSRPAAALVRL
jgi:glycerol uptake facilitator-like aquaporin